MILPLRLDNFHSTWKEKWFLSYVRIEKTKLVSIKSCFLFWPFWWIQICFVIVFWRFLVRQAARSISPEKSKCFHVYRFIFSRVTMTVRLYLFHSQEWNPLSVYWPNSWVNSQRSVTVKGLQWSKAKQEGWIIALASAVGWEDRKVWGNVWESFR